MKQIAFPLLIFAFSVSLLAQDFVDVTGSIGLNATFGTNGIFGGGVSFIDFNGDGLEGLLRLEGENVFYRDQSPDAVGLELPWQNNSFEGGLLRVYPSPFSGELIFELDLQQEGEVQLTLLDNLGREIRRLDASLEKGAQTLTFSNLGELPAGVYYYRMRVVGATRSGKIFKQ